MASPRARRGIAAAIVIAGLGVLLFAPGAGTIAFSRISESFFSRFDERYPASEAGTFATLQCFGEVAATIPDGSTVQISANDDSFAFQRFVDISFPRLEPVTAGGEYSIVVNGVDATNNAVLNVSCGDYEIDVVRND